MAKDFVRIAFGLVFLLSVCADVSAAPCNAAEDESSAAAVGEGAAILAEPIVISMQEVPVRGPTSATFPGGTKFLSGQTAACDEVPREAVKVYPKFVWKRPMYGRVQFDASLAAHSSGASGPSDRTEFHFAMDASAPPQDVVGSNGAPSRQPLILDLLYFDLNQDLDLTNDKVLKLTSGSLPKGTLSVDRPRPLVFEDLVLQCDFGPHLGRRPVRLTPRNSTCTTLTIGHIIQFLPKASRRGTFDLQGQQYVAQIQQNDVICGRYDRRSVYLDISPILGGRGSAAVAWGPLGDWHRIGGRFCTISATPMGDRLTIVPHQGDVGTIEFRGGQSDVVQITECTLTSAMASLPLVSSRPGLRGSVTQPQRFQVPVGDYAITSLNAFCGRLLLHCGPIPDEQNRLPSIPSSYPIQIRKDKPCVFSFQEKPSVTVLANRNDPKDYQRGQVARIHPRLVLPSFGLLLHPSYMMPSSRDEKPSVGLVPELHTVVVKNSRGDTVGQENIRGDQFWWRIPKDLELSGESETFSATVTFQTHGLYGPVEATFPIVVRR